MKRIILQFIILMLVVSSIQAKLVEVEVRHGDTLHGFALKYLKDPSKWPRIYEINKENITNPDKIYPGQIVKIPIEMLKDKVGDLVKLFNNVKIKKREKASWKEGDKGERLFPEDGIMTGKKSFARVDFLVGSNLKVYENSLMYLKPTKKKTAVASLLEGGLNVSKAKIITPAAEVIPRGESRYDIDVDKNKSTRVSVRAGEVDVKAQGETVTVVKGFRTVVALDKTPQAPIRLPLSGDEALEFKEELVFKKNMNFHTQVSDKEGFTNIIKDEKTTNLKLDYIKKGLKPGQYYWRAAVIDGDGFEGKFSEPRAFVIRSVSNALVELTGFEVINKKEGIMRIAGYARNARRIVVNGYPATVDNKGKFKTTIAILEKQDTITVTAIGGEGIVLRKYHRSEDGTWLPAQ